MPILIVFALATTSLGAEPEVDAAQFSRLMAEFHAKVRDVSFVFEGSDFGVPAGRSVEEALKAPDPRNFGRQYQGLYAFRDDGSTLLDSFVTHYGTQRDPAKIWTTRRTTAIYDHKRSAVSRYPDQRGESPTVGGGGPGTLNEPGSPERIEYYWYFKAFERYGPEGYGYEFQGWEEVDGHRCLRVQFDEIYGATDRPADRPVIRFWIDMERGGHPLKVEFARGEVIRMRTVGIELDHVALPGGDRMWFPVRGRTETFAELGRIGGKPAWIETYFVLDGTLRVNKGLPDRTFSVDYKGGLSETTELERKRREFRVPQPRQDPEGIRERLETTLATANAKSESDEIRVISPARQAWSGTRGAQAAFVALGILLLAYVGMRTWRSR